MVHVRIYILVLNAIVSDCIQIAYCIIKTFCNKKTFANLVKGTFPEIKFQEHMCAANTLEIKKVCQLYGMCT